MLVLDKRYTADPFNDWGGRGYLKKIPVLGGNDKKITLTGDVFDKPPGAFVSLHRIAYYRKQPYCSGLFMANTKKCHTGTFMECVGIVSFTVP